MTHRPRFFSSSVIHHSSFVILLAGCSGRADINFVSLNMTDIDPPPAKVFEFKAAQCYWWKDVSGELNIVLKHQGHNLLLGSLGTSELGLSFVFDRMPAGSGLDYRVRQREVRTLFLSPLAAQRFNAFAGIVAVIVRDDGTLRGSFRIWMVPQMELGALSFLPQRPGNVLCFGTFQAVPDERRGRLIRDWTEAGGWTRPARPPPSTRPAATQSDAPVQGND